MCGGYSNSECVCVCVCTYVNYILTSNKYNISFDYSYIIHL